MFRYSCTNTTRRHYIARAREHRPTVPAEVSNYIVETYVRLRKVGKEDEAQKKSHTYTSARTLLGVLRLAQALARLRFSNEVAHADVDEALRLMEVSKRSLVEDEDEGHDHDRSDVSKIFRLIKEMSKQAQSGKKGRKARGARRFGRGPGGEREMDVDSEEEEDTDELSMVDIRSRVLTNGFTEAQLMETILEVCCFTHQLCARVLTAFLLAVRKPRRLDARGEQLKTAFHRERVER